MSTITKNKCTVYSSVKLLIATEVYAQNEEEALTTGKMQLDDMAAIEQIQLSIQQTDGNLINSTVHDFNVEVVEVHEE